MSIPRYPACLPLVSIFLATATVLAGEPARRPVASRSERIARAQWQPVRPATEGARSGVTQAAAVGERSVLRPVQRTERIPTPTPLPEIEGEVVYEDGGIVTPLYESYIGPETYAGPAPCDAMMCDGSGCDGCGGMGCDFAVMCDSPGSACGPCGNGAWGDGCFTICAPRDGWFSAEYLLWQQREMILPSLVTRGATRGTLPGQSVFGGGDAMQESFSGMRFSGGIWLDRQHEWSLAGDYYGWDAFSQSAAFTSNGTNSLGRPFIDLSVAGAPADVQLIDFLGVVDGQNVNITGRIDVDVRSELHSGGFQFRRFLVANDGCGDTIFLNAPSKYRSRFDLGIGYRYTQLDEGLSITEDLTATAPTATSYDVFDSFETQTQFSGLDLGIFYSRQRGCWTLDLNGRFAVGTNQQNVNIDGGTRVNNGTLQPGGLLALSSNMGHYERERFAVLPELGGKLGYQITPRMRATIGYTFVYWSNVVRPGDAIDTQINSTLIPRAAVADSGSAAPQFRFNETDFWAQGVSFGGEFRW